jgi:hypothetical protein
MDLDRRSVIKAGALAGLAFAQPALALGRAPRPALFVWDARFTPSSDVARLWSTRGTALIDARTEDLGVAWRERIPELLHANPGGIEGVTLWSDKFICESFGRERGLGIRFETQVSEPSRGATPLLHWRLA